MTEPRKWTILLSTITVLAISCGNGEIPKASQSASEDPSAPAATQGSKKPLTLNGAGATFPYPVYSKWAYEYHKSSGTRVNYQSIGSGGGIAQIKAKTVDFGASDAPLTPQELQEEGLVQFPLVIGGVVPVIHLEGVAPGKLQLDGQTLSQIYLGNIKKWNHPAIAALNPHVTLPDAEVAVVHRADGSGTTWIFTHYLNRISPEWKEKVGAGRAVDWPTGMGGKGNEGVAAYVQRVKGAIGYVEFAYALQNHMSHVKIKNRAGQFVEPTMTSFREAALNADWPHSEGFHMMLTDQPGDQTWPITGASYILMHKQQENMRVAKEALRFFSWCYENGAKEAKELHYVPMPTEVVSLVRSLWKKALKVNGAAVL
jgi:phosphate transport system substrate-binding protein